MRVPFSWLKAYVPELESPEVLEERLAGLGFETDRIERVFPIPRGVVFARVLEAHPIPGTRLKRLVLDAGRTVEVVSGAENARKGIGVALALPGTELPGLGQKVGERVIQGVRSFGMALSPRELGVGEYGGGLLEFPEDALPPAPPFGGLAGGGGAGPSRSPRTARTPWAFWASPGTSTPWATPWWSPKRP